jgi:CheY-like chemotaxis protein
LTVRLEGDLARWPQVHGDKGRLAQVINNLINNALKFTEGQVRCRIRLDDDDGAGPQLAVEVEDEGPGIPEAQQAVIFERFVQLSDGFAKRFAGTGLGLPISRQLVDMMGGTLGLVSSPEAGSRFFFRLPLRPPVAEAEVVADAADDADLSRYQLLVVDDDRIGRLAAETILRNRGFRVATAEDGRQALQLVRERRFSAVLMDVHMPELDGIEVTRRIRAAPEPEIANLPIIGLTASVLEHERTTYLDAGMNVVLAKPLDFDAIKASVISLSLSPFADPDACSDAAAEAAPA